MLLRGVASWSLGISVALALASAWASMTGIYHIFANSSCFYLALGAGLLGLLLLFVGRKSKQASGVAVGADNKKLRVISWALTLFFVVSILLFVFLLAVPYYSSYPEPIDPKWWPPFVWGEFGSFLYEAAPYVWLSEILLLLPFAAVQGSILKKVWLRLNRVERITHASLVGASVIVALFTATLGQAFMYWLAD